MAPSNTFVSDVDASCRHKLLDSGDPLAGMSVTAADVRGDELGLLVYTSDAGAGAVCWSGVEGAPPNVTSHWDGAKGDLGPTQLCLWFNKGHGGEVSGRNSAHAVAGRHGDDIASVVIEGTVGGRVEATTVDGWFSRVVARARGGPHPLPHPGPRWLWTTCG